MRDCLTAGDSPLSLCLCAVLYGAFGYGSVLLINAGSDESGRRPSLFHTDANLSMKEAFEQQEDQQPTLKTLTGSAVSL